MDISSLPDDVSVTITISVGALRAALKRDNPDRALSSSEAAEEFGHTSAWWSRRAPDVPGSYQAAEGAPWSLPRKGCRAYLAALQNKAPPWCCPIGGGGTTPGPAVGSSR